MPLPYEAACISAVLSSIRSGVTNISLDYTNSGIEPGGHPPPRTGRIYLAVDQMGVFSEGAPEQDHIKERIRIAVYISMRSGRKAPDRTGDIWLETVASFGPIDRQVKAAIHGKHAVRSAAIALMDPLEQEIQEPLWYVGSETRIEPSSWSTETADDNSVTGWAVRIVNFMGFRRVQSNTSIA